MTKLIKPLVVTTSIMGVILTVWGLANLAWPSVLPWAGVKGFASYLIFTGACFALAFGFSVWGKRNPYLIGIVIALCLALFANALWSLFVVIWLSIASIIFGRRFLLLIKIQIPNDWLTSFLVGLSVYGTVVGILAHYPVNYPGVYCALLTLPMLVYWKDLHFYFREFSSLIAKHSQPQFSSKLDIAITVVALGHFVTAFMPELGHDALAFHLFVPAQMASIHQWGFDVSKYVWASMPMLGDWIFTIVYMIGDETASRLINFEFVLIIGLLVRHIVLWAGGSIQGARWAVLIFLSTPLTYTLSSTLYIDSFLSALLISGVLAFLRQFEISDKPANWLALASILLGFALATKSTTFMVFPALFLIALFYVKTLFKAKSLTDWIKAATLFSVAGLIPYGTAWFLTGNPVFPFFNGLFQSRYYAPMNFENVLYEKGLTWDVLYQVTFNSGRYLEASAGAAGFQWLLLFLPAVVLLLMTRQRKGLLILTVGLLFIFTTFQFTSYLRYAFPAVIFLVTSIGIGFNYFNTVESRKITLSWFSILTITVGLNLLFLTSGTWLYRTFPIMSVWNKSQRQAHIQESLPIRNAVDLVNQINSKKSPVVVFAHPLVAGLQSDALYFNWYNPTFFEQMTKADTPDAINDILKIYGVNYVIIDLNMKYTFAEHLGKLTRKVAEYGSINVLQVTGDIEYTEELLKNTNFSASEGWYFGPGVEFDESTVKVLKVRVSDPAAQAVAVSPGRKYQNSVVARCFSEVTTGRIQINWLDAKGQFIDANIKTFDCTNDWLEYSDLVESPKNAAQGIVYVTSHTETPILFKSASLKK